MLHVTLDMASDHQYSVAMDSDVPSDAGEPLGALQVDHPYAVPWDPGAEAVTVALLKGDDDMTESVSTVRQDSRARCSPNK